MLKRLRHKKRRSKSHDFSVDHRWSDRSFESGESPASSAQSSLVLKSCLKESSSSGLLGDAELDAESVPSASHASVPSVSHASAVSPEDYDDSNPSHSSSKQTSKASFASTYVPKPHRDRRNVKFHHVQIQEYERIISDNPSCSSGAPVGIGWAHSKEKIMPLDEYESAKPGRRDQYDLILTRQDREEILMEWGATFQQVVEAIRANIRAKNQRRRTVQNIGTYDRWEEVMESAGRRLKRTLLLQKSTDAQVQEQISHLPRLPQRRGSDAGSGPPSVVHHEDLSIGGSSVSSGEGHHHAQHPTSNDVLDASRTSFATSIATEATDRSGPAPLVEVSDLPDNFEQNYPQSQPPHVVPSQYPPLDHQHHMQNNPMMYVVPPQQHMNGAVQQNGWGYGYVYGPNDGEQDDEGSDNTFSNLVGDNSYWVVGGTDAPEVRRLMAPVVISEDGQYDLATDYSPQYGGSPPPPYGDNGGSGAGGFSLQQASYSNTIIRRWE